MSSLVVIVLIASTTLVLWTAVWRLQRRLSLPLPPGPPADPIIGHVRMIPLTDTHLFFHKLSKTYGKVICLRVPSKTFIILNGTKEAVDLLEKRSAIYSDRGHSVIMVLMGWVANLVFAPYGDFFRRHRRLMNAYLNQTQSVGHHPIQLDEARKLLQNIASTPENFIDHLNRFSSGIILRVVHGHEIVNDDDPYLKITDDVTDGLARCAMPYSNSVDFFPFLQYFPSWFPGTGPASQAKSMRPAVDKMHQYPFNDVRQQMSNGTFQESFLSRHLEGLGRNGAEYPYSTIDIQGAAAIMYIAGADTTWSTLYIFMLAMVLYPDVQAKAQEELDGVVDADRSPTFDDRSNLRYLEGVIQETYRWHNAVPSGIPHRCMKDDIYEGMFIPKGSIVIANTRGMTLDEDVYSNPTVFDPLRYERGEPQPIAQFGFGRRLCPGRHLGDSSVWICIASVLSAFKISPTLDQQGDPILPPEEFLTGLASHPKPFKCNIVPRVCKV